MFFLYVQFIFKKLNMKEEIGKKGITAVRCSKRRVKEGDGVVKMSKAH
jgi:hypothetical protein